jgi:hypothetical protein
MQLFLPFKVIGRYLPRFYQQVLLRKGPAYFHPLARHPRRSSLVAFVVATAELAFKRLDRSTSRRTRHSLQAHPPSGTVCQTRPATA